MKLGTEDRKKLILAGVAGVVLLFAGYYAYSAAFGGTPTPPPQAPVIVDATPKSMGGSTSASPVRTAAGATGVPAIKVATVSRALDPTLHMGPMLAAEALVYGGTGRNIFAPGPTAAEVAQIAKAQFDARPKPQSTPQQAMNTGPAPPPVINLKFFGIATQAGRKRALLLSGEDVFLAFAGDIVDRRYKITAVNATFVTVEDMQNRNTQNLPLLAN